MFLYAGWQNWVLPRGRKQGLCDSLTPGLQGQWNSWLFGEQTKEATDMKPAVVGSVCSEGRWAPEKLCDDGSSLRFDDNITSVGKTKRNSRRRAWRRTSPTSAECLSRSIMETVSSLTCDPEMPSYLGDPSPRGGPLVGASHLSRASLWASREQEQTVSRVHRPCHHSPQQQHQGIRAAESQRCGEAVIVKLLLKYGANYVQSSRVNPPLFPPVRTIQTISQDCGHGPGPPWLRRWMAGPQRDGGKVTRTLPSGSGPRWQAGGDQSAGAHKPVPTEGLASSGRDMQASRTWQEWTAVPINTCVCAPTVCR